MFGQFYVLKGKSKNRTKIRNIETSLDVISKIHVIKYSWF